MRLCGWMAPSAGWRYRDLRGVLRLPAQQPRRALDRATALASRLEPQNIRNPAARVKRTTLRRPPDACPPFNSRHFDQNASHAST
jgi:hypothetical protein